MIIILLYVTNFTSNFEQFRSGFQTENRNRAHFLVCFRISFIPNHFNRNRNRNRFVPCHIWICNHLWHLSPKCDQICFAKKTKKKPERVTEATNSKLWHFVTVTNVTHWVWLVQSLFMFLFSIRIGTTLRNYKTWTRLTDGYSLVRGGGENQGGSGWCNILNGRFRIVHSLAQKLSFCFASTQFTRSTKFIT